MKLQSIYDEWGKDSVINPTDLGNESLKIPKLHHKYFQFFSHERMVLKKYEADLKVLRLNKFEFFTQGPTKNTMDLGWELPAVGKVLRSDVATYMEADRDIIEMTLKIAMQHEKIELLESIIKSLHGRGFQIKTSLDWIKFNAGVS